MLSSYEDIIDGTQGYNDAGIRCISFYIHQNKEGRLCGEGWVYQGIVEGDQRGFEHIVCMINFFWFE